MQVQQLFQGCNELSIITRCHFSSDTRCILLTEIPVTLTYSTVGVSSLLEETTIFQVFFDDDVSHGIKHKLDVLCVCGTGHVRVDFLDVSTQVEVQELNFDVVTSILVSVWALTKRQ